MKSTQETLGACRIDARATERESFTEYHVTATIDGAIGQTEFNNHCTRHVWSNPGSWSQDTGFRWVKDLP